ncbi:MAG: potassium-transporting ATPase subunit KdpC [Silvanigrellaceae bacterium]|jgi:K+-transporting ATPase ATPase C chain|nr:potassium-transporting ATPase subunit KdpC [Silvanigrellaceae bacterium]
MLKTFYRAISFSLFMYILLGLIYPSATYLLGSSLFPKQSKGSLIFQNEIPVGSEFIGQNFSQPKYFWGRPSAAGEKGYDATNSGASNLATTNKDLLDRIEKSIQEFLKQNPTIKREEIPTDLVTASASGLDPEISIQSAKIQIPRIAKARNISENNLTLLVDKLTQNPTLSFIGTERVNVLLLNNELDKETSKMKN